MSAKILCALYHKKKRAKFVCIYEIMYVLNISLLILVQDYKRINFNHIEGLHWVRQQTLKNKKFIITSIAYLENQTSS